jgi:hypothetical protein
MADLGQDAKVVAGFIPKVERKRDLIRQIYLEVTDKARFDSTAVYGELPWQTFASLFFSEKRLQNSLNKISKDKFRKKLLEYFVLQNTLET